MTAGRVQAHYSANREEAALTSGLIVLAAARELPSSAEGEGERRTVNGHMTEGDSCIVASPQRPEQLLSQY